MPRSRNRGHRALVVDQILTKGSFAHLVLLIYFWIHIYVIMKRGHIRLLRCHIAWC